MYSLYLLTATDTEIPLGKDCAEYSIGFVNGITDREISEMESRGYLSHVYIVNKRTQQYWPLCFYDCIRISQDIDDERYVNDIGLTVVKEVTLDIIHGTCESFIRTSDFTKVKSYNKQEMCDIFNLNLWDGDCSS